MKLFDQIGKKVTNASSNVAQQTKNLAEITRINSAIYTEERNISNKYSELGESYYRKYTGNTNAEFSEIINSINESLKKIEQYKEEINSIKGIIKCPHCGKDVPLGAQFCNSCGEKIVRTKPDTKKTTQAKDVCPSCGEKIHEGNKFCIKCGYKFEEDEREE